MNEPPHIDLPKLTVERRWHAARRLAAGDSTLLAAARAGLHESQVSSMLRDDADFVQLVEDARGVSQLSAGQRSHDLRALALEAFEDGICTRSTTVVNQAMKAFGQLDIREELATNQDAAGFLGEISGDELYDYLWIGVRSETSEADRACMPYEPPDHFKATVDALILRIEDFTSSRRSERSQPSSSQENVDNMVELRPGIMRDREKEGE